MWTKCTRSAFVSLSLSLLVALPVSSQTVGTHTPVASRLTQPVNESDLVTLQGTVHRLATPANDRGAANSGLPLERLQVSLKRSPAQESALQQTIQQMHTPGSLLFHKWLTPAQFGEQFGPSDADIATISSWLGTHGFAVTKVNPGKQTMEISGTAAQFSSTFHSQIHKYQANGQMHYANASDPQIPAALAPVFGGFASLNNFQLKSQLKRQGTAQMNPVTHKTTGSWSEGTNGVYLIVAPGDFAVQYDLTPLYTAGVNGAGQTIGIINEANINPALVAQYRSLFSLPVSPVNVIVDGSDPGIDGDNNPDGPNGASVEAYLDVEEAGSVAPGATIDLIIAADTALNGGLGLAAEHAVYGNVAPVLSISFLSCEVGQGTFWNNLWEQAAAQGQTVMVSAGDAGSAGCDDDDSQFYAVNGQRVNGIASTPYNVAVGGTDFYYSSYNQSQTAQGLQLQDYWNLEASNSTPTTSISGVIPEQPWNDSQYGLNLTSFYAETGDTETSIVGGGGGASNCATGSGTSCKGYAKPGFQSASTPSDGVRDLPDVSLFAANGANYSFYPICASNGDCQPAPVGGDIQITAVGGTSASSPAFAGIMALVNEKYGPQGQADFVLYPLEKQYPAAFHDVVNGTNSVPCAITAISYNGSSIAPDDCIAVASPLTVTDPTFGSAKEGQIGTGTTAQYNAAIGYDLASGLGSVDANVLVSDWNKITFANTALTLTPSQTTFAHGTSITVSGTVTPATATGNVSLETTSTEPLQAGQTTFPVTNGTYSGTISYLPGGTYSIYGLYSGDATNGPSTSAKTSITVSQQASTTQLEALNSYSGATNPTGLAFASGATISYGTQVLLDAEPLPSTSSSSYGTPTGSVNYLSGTNSIGTAQVNSAGEASLNFAPLPSATAYSITAAYSGDASYAASTSSAVTFTVTKDTPTLSLASGSQTTTTLSAVSGLTALTVGVENSANLALQNKTRYAFQNSAAAPTGVVTVSGLPSGTLTFPALSGVVDPNTLFPEGVATTPLPTEKAGTYSLTISYPGDSNYAAISSSVTITITSSSLVPTTTTASASSSSTTTTGATTVTFTILGATGDSFPTGNVYFLVSGSSIGYLTLPTTGSGDSVTETVGLDGVLSTGANQIVVEYTGSATYAPSYATVSIGNTTAPSFALSNTGGISVTPGASGTSTIQATSIGGLSGSVALSCAVTGSSTAGTPTCSVTSPVTLSATGSPVPATLTLSTSTATPLGIYTVTVTGVAGGNTITSTVLLTVETPSLALTQSGAISEAAGSSGTSTITVTPAGGFTGLVTLTCTVTPTTGVSVPTCAVPNASVLGPAAATAILTVTSSSTTPTGPYTATVTATGTGVATQTTAVTVTVTAAPVNPTVSLANSGSITIATPGGSGTSAITATLGGGLTAGGVTLSCSVSSTASEAPTCSVGALSGSASAPTATLTVSTTAATAELKMPKTGLLPIGGGVAFATMLFFVVPAKRRRIGTLLGALVLIAFAGFAAGCGGGGTPVSSGNPGTPAGNYTVTVTGTASGATAATTSVSVTVQ